ncbi:MAG: ABC transporter ATP-binding protein [Candidatus Methanomethylicia archaeon]
MNPIIEALNLSFRYSGEERWAIKSINLKIYPGEFVLITGPSGCGKTTLCRCFNGLIPHFYEGELKGILTVDGLNIAENKTCKLAQRVGMVFQNPENQLIMLSVEDEIAFGLENLNLPRDIIRERVDEVLSILGIEHLRHKFPYELSGGEQQKVAIAACLAMRPKILVLDEPTAHLDPLSSKVLFDTLSSIRKRLNLTIILVEHRLDMVASITDKVIVMDKGQIILQGRPREVFTNPIIKAIGIGVPKLILLYEDLLLNNLKLDFPPLNIDEAELLLRKLLSR